MKTAFKILASRSLTLLLAISILFSSVILPRAYAYFSTRGPGSPGFTFYIHNSGSASRSTGANLTLFRPFLFEEAETDTRFIDGSPTERIPAPGEMVEAQISIPHQDFHAHEIFIPSVKLHYENQLGFAQGGEVTGTGLIVRFDLCEIWTWFQDAPGTSEQVTLIVSGEGYKEDGSIFFFSGEATVFLKGKYNISADHPAPEKDPLVDSPNSPEEVQEEQPDQGTIFDQDAEDAGEPKEGSR